MPNRGFTACPQPSTLPAMTQVEPTMTTPDSGGPPVWKAGLDAARANAVRAGIDNAEFLVGAVEGRLPELAARYGVPDRVVVDPPRAGLHPKARRALLDLAAARIVYVSCNPRSQAVDLIDLAQRYRVVQLQPVDMFPQTRHVECIAVLERNDTP